MSVKLVFSFPVDITPALALREVADHFGVSVSTEPVGETVIPAHIKHAVETVGAEIIASQEMNPAVAFGGLLNGSAGKIEGNAPAVGDVPSFAVAEVSPIVQTGQTATSAITPPASSPVAAQQTTVAPTDNAAAANPASVDSTGLPWDARIHSSPATITDKGVWRKKRGATPTVVKQVETELRALVGNATQSEPPVSAQSFVDEQARKRAALEHAHNKAIEICGASPIDGATLQQLLQNKPATLSPQQADWYSAYFACRNKAYTDFLAASVATAVSEQPATTTTAVAEQQASPSIPVASLTAAAGTVTHVPNVLPATPDATGLNWDARIHVTPPTTDGAGIFVQRMDVAPAEKLQIMAELRGNVAAPVSTAPDTPVSSAPVVPTVVVDNPGASFPAMMKWLVGNQLAKRITPQQIGEVAAMFGLIDQSNGSGSIALSSQRAELWPQIVETLKMYGAV